MIETKLPRPTWCFENDSKGIQWKNIRGFNKKRKGGEFVDDAMFGCDGMAALYRDLRQALKVMHERRQNGLAYDTSAVRKLEQQIKDRAAEVSANVGRALNGCG